MSRKSILAVSTILALMAAAPGCSKKQQQEEKKPRQIPQMVLDSLNARFSGAEIRKWTRETEGDSVIYDIEFVREGKKMEADLSETGAIMNWEMEVAQADMPEAVKSALESRFPQAEILEIMQIHEIRQGGEVLEGYEILLRTAAGEEHEITFTPEGKILEESGEEQ